MNTLQDSYRCLAEKYKDGSLVTRKMGISGLLIQTAFIGAINSWERLEIGYAQIAVPMLFFVSIYFLLKDFFVLRGIEQSMAQMILEGVEIETKNASFGRFFHDILKAFNLTSVLTKRSLINVLVLSCVGYPMIQLVSKTYPEITIDRWFLSLLTWIPGLIASKLYYDSMKDLDEAKRRVFAKQFS